MENKETEKRILTEKEMEQASGGFEYQGVLEWLKGYNIACPNCGNDSEDSISKRYATGLHIYYTCGHCGQNFYYTMGLNKKIKVVKE